MAHISADRVRDTSTSTGTGTFVVSGTAPTAFVTFSAVCTTNDTFYYAIQHQTAAEWEVGLGTYSSANTITRTTVYASSAAGSAVTFSTGTKDVFITLAAARTIQYTGSGNVGINTTSPQLKLHVVGPQGAVASFPTLSANTTSVYENALNAKIALVNSGAAGTSSVIESYASGDAYPRNGITLNSPSSFISFGTGTGAATYTERMRITSAGDVGIGTSSPSGKLHVSGGRSYFTANSEQFDVALKYNAATSGVWLGSPGTDAFTVSTEGGAERMRIDSSGNVGIGTSSPTAKITAYSGGTNATTYNTMIAAGGGSTATIQNQGTTSVSTTATTILTSGQYGSFCLVFGSDGTNRFMDVVLFGLGTGTVNVISSLSVAGSPSARTYSQSSSTYKLAMASGTYTVQVAAFSMSG